MKKVLAILRNKYYLVFIFMLVWLVFFDKNNVFERFSSWWELRSLNQAKEYYLEQIEETERIQEELFNDQQSLERFARERYLMKKDNEDIFIVVEE